MNTLPLRVGIIGDTKSGGYGHKLHAGFKACKAVELIAVADEDPVGLRATALDLGNLERFTSYQAMLNNVDLDAVVVAPRDVQRHEEYVMASLDAGCSVYCEKPFTQDLAQADRLLAFAEKRGLTLAVALPGGHEPRFLDVLKRIRENEIGKVLSVRGLCKWDTRGGGEDALVLGLHLVDLSRRILGEARSVFAHVSQRQSAITKSDARLGGEGVGLVAGDAFLAVVTHKSGIVSTLESYKCEIEDRSLQPYRLEIIGTNGTIIHRAPYADGSTWINENSSPHPNDAGWKRIAYKKDDYLSHHTRAAYDFVYSVRNNQVPMTSGKDGMLDLEIIHAAYISALKNQVVSLPLENREHPLANVGT